MILDRHGSRPVLYHVHADAKPDVRDFRQDWKKSAVAAFYDCLRTPMVGYYLFAGLTMIMLLRLIQLNRQGDIGPL